VGLTITGISTEAQLLVTWEPRVENAAEFGPDATGQPVAPGAPGRLVTVAAEVASATAGCGAPVV
jgi:hypothetical protein